MFPFRSLTFSTAVWYFVVSFPSFHHSCQLSFLSSPLFSSFLFLPFSHPPPTIPSQPSLYPFSPSPSLPSLPTLSHAHRQSVTQFPPRSPVCRLSLHVTQPSTPTLPPSPKATLTKCLRLGKSGGGKEQRRERAEEGRSRGGWEEVRVGKKES